MELKRKSMEAQQSDDQTVAMVSKKEARLSNQQAFFSEIMALRKRRISSCEESKSLEWKCWNQLIYTSF